MRLLSYSRPTDVSSAIGTVSADVDSHFLAGGTGKVDLMRLYVEQPGRVVDISRLPLTDIQPLQGGGLRIGALARMNDVAGAARVRRAFPVLSEALLLGASPQLRNMASMGGNLMQRVRCAYFRDVASACNKRVPGSGCSALTGFNRGHAVLGTSECCIATHPSDAAVALVALGAVVQTANARGRRKVPIDDFFLLPGDTPEREHPLEQGELIVAIDVPPLPDGARSTYLKIRDRQSYEFALASVAAAVRVEDGVITDARVALGGVATKPWRARRAERVLVGAPATVDTFAAAAESEMEPAVSYGLNGFKIDLAQRTMVRALRTVTGAAGAG